MAGCIALLDYGMGNLRSVVNAFQARGAALRVTSEPADVLAADAVILPGVGAFGAGMAGLRAAGLLDALEEVVRRQGKPFLGICLGMQLLATEGEEHGCHAGLGWLPGCVRRLSPTGGLRVPHIGWNDVTVARGDGLFVGFKPGTDFYFVHSYAFEPDDPAVASARCDYGGEFVAAVECGNIAAVQFHPEKSHQAGQRLIGNWLSRVAAC